MVLWCQCYTVTVLVESMVESPSRSAVCARSDPPQIRGSVAASAGGGSRYLLLGRYVTLLYLSSPRRWDLCFSVYTCVYTVCRGRALAVT